MRRILSWSFVGTNFEMVAATAPAEQVGTVPHIFLAPATLILDLLDSSLAFLYCQGARFSCLACRVAVGLDVVGRGMVAAVVTANA